jgi:hypothetical protein
VDDIVTRAMQKWPDVPDVYGWLRLDRRGRWLVKSRAGAFERIGNQAVTEFIGRNYAADLHGRWFFQNGPQRVFVALDYTPWVWRLSDDAACLLAHSGRVVSAPARLLLDENGVLLVESELGVGVVSDRDLLPLLDQLESENPLLRGGGVLTDLVAAPQPADLLLFGRPVLLGHIHSSAVASAYGFDPAPRPAPGEPDC